MKTRSFVAKHLHINRPAVEQDKKKEEKKRGTVGRFFDEEQLDLLDNAEQESEDEAD